MNQKQHQKKPQVHHVIILALLLGFSIRAHAQIIAGPYLQAPTQSSITVVVETKTDRAAPVFLASREGTRAVLGQIHRVPATTEPGDVPVILQKIKLEGLKPGETYIYDVDAGDGEKKAGTFILPNPSVPHIAITSNPNALAPAKAQQAWRQIAKAPGSMIWISGDLSNKASNREYRQFIQRAGPVLANKVLLTVPGNHDLREWSTYDAWFVNEYPGTFNAHYYVADFPGLRLVGINDRVPRLKDFPTIWFERVLKESPAPWTVVMSNGNYRKFNDMRLFLEKQAAAGLYDVLVTAGSGNQYRDNHGVVHFENGGGEYRVHLVQVSSKGLSGMLVHHTGQILKEFTFPRQSVLNPPTNVNVK